MSAKTLFVEFGFNCHPLTHLKTTYMCRDFCLFTHWTFKRTLKGGCLLNVSLLWKEYKLRRFQVNKPPTDTPTCHCHSGRFLADKQCSPSRRCRRRSTAGSCSAPRLGSTQASRRSVPMTRLWAPPCRMQTGSCCSPCSPPRPSPSRRSPTCRHSAVPA